MVYDCRECERSPGLKQSLGHDGPPVQYWTENLLTGAPLAECPLRTLLRARATEPAVAAEVVRHVDEFYPAYRDGHLLTAGGLADQPRRYLEYMRMIAALERDSQRTYDRLTRPAAEGEA